MLKTVIAKEPVGSRRWFLLQQVRAWGALRAELEDQEAALQIYSDIFKKEASAKQVKADEVLMHTVYELVSALSFSRFAPVEADTSLLVEVLDQALAIHLAVLQSGKQKMSKPNWSKVLKAQELTSEDAHLLLLRASKTLLSARSDKQAQALAVATEVRSSLNEVKVSDH